MTRNTSLVLLDDGVEWHGDFLVIAHWEKLVVSESEESIPKLVEKNKDKIRKDYFAWVHDLGQTSINGKTLVSILNFSDSLSYWWMTSIAVKSPFENDSLYTIFKLRALEQLYLEKNCHGLIYYGNSLALDRTLQAWSKKLGHNYEKFRPKKKIFHAEKGVRRWLRKLPYWMQALAYLLKNWFSRYRHIRSIGSGVVKKIQGGDGVTVVTYFPNVDKEKINKGEFRSLYWDSLHPLLERLPFKINWVWLSMLGPNLSFKEIVSQKNICNQVDLKKNQHFLFEEFLTPTVFFKALKLYFKIYIKGLSFKKIREEFHFSGSQLNFFLHLEKEWKASFYGNLAIEGAIRIAVFESMAKKLSAIPWGLFLWEGLSNDIALMASWRENSKQTKIIAYQHGFFRPFDLRLCSDSRDFKLDGKEAMPLPDKLCINNEQGLSLIRETGFPEEKIAKVEAARYFGLKGKRLIYKKPIPPTERTLLVIMGIKDQENQFQFRFLNEAAKIGGLRKYSQIIIKPHPGLSSDGFKIVHESNFKFSLKDQPLSELWALADVVYGAHSTGALWEASWYGLPAISVCPMNSFNFNPMMGLPEVCFVANGVDLSEHLKKPKLVEIPEDYFFFSENLELWEALLRE